ncbi:MAG: hypothetical protein QXP68_01905 [Thermosphaera sp.]
MSSKNQLDAYIVCERECSLRYIEALAMIGLLEKAGILECEKPRFKRISGVTITGKRVESKCFFDEEVEQSLRIINIYIGFARRHEASKQLTIAETTKELGEA